MSSEGERKVAGACQDVGSAGLRLHAAKKSFMESRRKAAI